MEKTLINNAILNVLTINHRYGELMNLGMLVKVIMVVPMKIQWWGKFMKMGRFIDNIIKNRPIVVALNAAPDLYYYSSGVFITNA